MPRPGLFAAGSRLRKCTEFLKHGESHEPLCMLPSHILADPFYASALNTHIDTFNYNRKHGTGVIKKSLNSVHDRLFERPEAHAKLVDRLGCVQLVDWWETCSRGAFRCQVVELGKVLSDYIADLLVAVCRIGDQVPLPSCCWLFKGSGMGFGN